METQQIIITSLTSRNYSNFAANTAITILELDNGIEELYLIATNNLPLLPSTLRSQVQFRSAYILEYIYFNYRDKFTPFRDRFISDYPQCQNQSAKRHFTKMMANILKTYTPPQSDIELIADATAQWIADPKVKVAVKVWAMSILKTLKPKVDWISEIWDDLESVAMNNATPGMEVRFRRGWE